MLKNFFESLINLIKFINIENKKKGSKVSGAIWEITKEHEEILDSYEQFPNIYQKRIFLCR